MLSAPALIIDCDTGRDDALAIWLALKWKRNLVALAASYGNTTRDNVIENCLRVLAFAGRPDIPVLVGPAAPPQTHKGVDDVIVPRQRTSGNGMCNLELPASGVRTPSPLNAPAMAARVAELAAIHGKLDYVVTGPASNLAAMLKVWGTDAQKHIARITMMGGKLSPLWDSMPTPDFNIICDPYAVDTLLASGIETRLVSMNTTWPIALPLADVERLEPRDPLATFAKALMIAHCKYFATEQVFRFHDPSVIAALDDTCFADTHLRVDTDEKSYTFGQLTEDAAGHSAKLHRADEERRTAMLAAMLDGLGFQPQAAAAAA